MTHDRSEAEKSIKKEFGQIQFKRRAVGTHNYLIGPSQQAYDKLKSTPGLGNMFEVIESVGGGNPLDRINSVRDTLIIRANKIKAKIDSTNDPAVLSACLRLVQEDEVYLRQNKLAKEVPIFDPLRVMIKERLIIDAASNGKKLCESLEQFKGDVAKGNQKLFAEVKSLEHLVQKYEAAGESRAEVVDKYFEEIKAKYRNISELSEEISDKVDLNHEQLEKIQKFLGSFGVKVEADLKNLSINDLILIDSVDKLLNYQEAQQRAQAEEAMYEGAADGFKLFEFASVITGDKRLAVIGQIGQECVRGIQAFNKLGGLEGISKLFMGNAFTLASFTPITAMIGAGLTIFQLVSGNQQKSELQVVMEYLESLSEAIFANFREIQRELKVIYEAMIDGFKEVIENIDVLKDNTANLEEKLMAQFDVLFAQLQKQPIVDLNKFDVDLKANCARQRRIGDETFRNNIDDILTKLFISIDGICTSNNGEHLLRLEPTNLEALRELNLLPAVYMLNYLSAVLARFDAIESEDIKSSKMINITLFYHAVKLYQEQLCRAPFDPDHESHVEMLKAMLANTTKFIKLLQTSDKPYHAILNAYQEIYNSFFDGVQELLVRYKAFELGEGKNPGELKDLLKSDQAKHQLKLFDYYSILFAKLLELSGVEKLVKLPRLPDSNDVIAMLQDVKNEFKTLQHGLIVNTITEVDGRMFALLSTGSMYGAGCTLVVHSFDQSVREWVPVESKNKLCIPPLSEHNRRYNLFTQDSGGKYGPTFVQTINTVRLNAMRIDGQAKLVISYTDVDRGVQVHEFDIAQCEYSKINDSSVRWNGRGARGCERFLGSSGCANSIQTAIYKKGDLSQLVMIAYQTDGGRGIRVIGLNMGAKTSYNPRLKLPLQGKQFKLITVPNGDDSEVFLVSTAKSRLVISKCQGDGSFTKVAECSGEFDFTQIKLIKKKPGNAILISSQNESKESVTLHMFNPEDGFLELYALNSFEKQASNIKKQHKHRHHMPRRMPMRRQQTDVVYTCLASRNASPTFITAFISEQSQLTLRYIDLETKEWSECKLGGESVKKFISATRGNHHKLNLIALPVTGEHDEIVLTSGSGSTLHCLYLRFGESFRPDIASAFKEGISDLTDQLSTLEGEIPDMPLPLNETCLQLLDAQVLVKEIECLKVSTSVLPTNIMLCANFHNDKGEDVELIQADCLKNNAASQ